jgi:hypothetical protein
MAEIARVQPPAVLMELVEHFSVCWETLPEVIDVKNEKRQVGFAVQLFGTHEPKVAHPKERCSHCQNVFAALHVIADWVLAREHSARMSEAEVHSPCGIYSPSRPIRSGVTFGIRVVSRRAFDKVSDDSVTQWLEESEERLKALGVIEVRTQGTERLVEQGRSV